MQSPNYMEKSLQQCFKGYSTKYEDKTAHSKLG